jgi:arylsulfatase A-like enzyme
MSRHKIREFGVQLSEQAFSQTYPAILRKAGWWTGYVGKYGIGKIRENSFDYSIEYEGRHWLKTGNRDSIHVTRKNTLDAIKFLNERPKDKPFLLTVGFFATHAQDNHPDQYLYQPESEKYYSKTVIPVPETASDKYFNLLPPFLSNEKNEGRIRWHWRFDTPVKYQKYMKAYFRMLTELDIAVGEITAELKKQGVLENTMIIFMGDNGYFHSEHGLADKWYPYQESIKVPLIVCDPRLSKSKRNTVNEEFVLNIDIAPAIIAAIGQPIPETIQGKDFSILYLNEKKQDWRKEFFYEHPFVTSEQRIPSSEALVTHFEKYIYWPHYNYEEYFDLVSDPREVRNAIKDTTCSKKIEAMKNRFVKLREQAE